MKIIYMADDGTTFDNEFDCEDYDFKIKLPWVFGISFYDEKMNLISNDPFDDYTYNHMFYVDIKTEIDYNSFMKAADYSGYCEYEKIPGAGKWHYIESNESWKKIND